MLTLTTHKEFKNLCKSCMTCYNCILVDRFYVYEDDEYYDTYECYLTKERIINTKPCESYEPDWNFS